jgi:hypothetical protein
MALINKVLPGYVATLWMQDSANPTAFSDADLSVWAQVSTLIGASAGGTGSQSGGGQTCWSVPVEAVPAFGADDAFAAYSIAGQRTGAKITTQNQVTSLTVTAPWNPADPAQLLIRDDGYNGTIIRTFVIAVYDGEDTVAYAFNARIGGLKWDMAPNAEGKFEFVIHPVGLSLIHI